MPSAPRRTTPSGVPLTPPALPSLGPSTVEPPMLWSQDSVLAVEREASGVGLSGRGGAVGGYFTLQEASTTQLKTGSRGGTEGATLGRDAPPTSLRPGRGARPH